MSNERPTEMDGLCFSPGTEKNVESSRNISIRILCGSGPENSYSLAPGHWVLQRFCCAVGNKASK